MRNEGVYSSESGCMARQHMHRGAFECDVAWLLTERWAGLAGYEWLMASKEFSE